MRHNGPANPHTPRLRQLAGGHCEAKQRCRRTGPRRLVLRYLSGESYADQSNRASQADQADRAGQAGQASQRSERIHEGKPMQRRHQAPAFSIAHQPSVKGEARVGWRDRMLPWMATHELTWTYLQRVPPTHPCLPSATRACSPAFAPPLQLQLQFLLPLPLPLQVAQRSRKLGRRSKKKPRCQPASRHTSWGRPRITWDAQNRQNMCRPPFTA